MALWIISEYILCHIHFGCLDSTSSSTGLYGTPNGAPNRAPKTGGGLSLESLNTLVLFEKKVLTQSFLKIQRYEFWIVWFYFSEFSEINLITLFP